MRAFAASGSAVPAPAKVSGLPQNDELGSVDDGFFADRVDKVAEPERRAFTYFMLSGARFAYASAARLLVVKLVGSYSTVVGLPLYETVNLLTGDGYKVHFNWLSGTTRV